MIDSTRMSPGKRIAIAAAALALVISGLAQAQYKWTDPDGRVVYGDNPPRDARNVQRIDARGASGEADTLAGLPFEARRAVQNFPVLLYTTENCQACDAGRELLRARGVPYGERTVTSKEDSDQLEKLGLGNRLPVLTVGRQVHKEFEASEWHSLLDAAGYPRAAQLPRNWPTAPVPLTPRAPQPPPPGKGTAAPAEPQATR